MWIIVSREYNDDPVFRSMAPLTTYSSRRRTILVFVNPGGGQPVERYSIGRFDYDKLYTMVPTANDAQWEGLRTLVAQKDPKVIGVNESESWNHADGLTANEKRLLLQALGEKYAARVKSAEMLAVGWLEYKLPEELEAYRHVMRVAHLVIGQAFSNAGDHARQDHHRGRGVVDAPAGRRDGPGQVVPAVGDDLAARRRQGRHGDPPGRHAAHRLRPRLPRLLHRHAAPRLRAEAGRDRRAAGLARRAEGGQPPAGPDDGARQARPHRQPGAARHPHAGDEGRAGAVDLLPSRWAITATPPARRSA